jgi:hypothetical protein
VFFGLFEVLGRRGSLRWLRENTENLSGGPKPTPGVSQRVHGGGWPQETGTRGRTWTVGTHVPIWHTSAHFLNVMANPSCTLSKSNEVDYLYTAQM